mgnify:FL=1
MLFLVKGIITFTPYMRSSQESKTTRIVEADNEEEATLKFEKYFRDQSTPNDDSYYATVTDVYECIV